jgi:hypothetical protein
LTLGTYCCLGTHLLRAPLGRVWIQLSYLGGHSILLGSLLLLGLEKLLWQHLLARLLLKVHLNLALSLILLIDIVLDELHVFVNFFSSLDQKRLIGQKAALLKGSHLLFIHMLDLKQPLGSILISRQSKKYLSDLVNPLKHSGQGPQGFCNKLLIWRR